MGGSHARATNGQSSDSESTASESESRPRAPASSYSRSVAKLRATCAACQVALLQWRNFVSLSVGAAALSDGHTAGLAGSLAAWSQSRMDRLGPDTGLLPGSDASHATRASRGLLAWAVTDSHVFTSPPLLFESLLKR